MSADRFVRGKGIRLHYLEHDGDGPTVVLTHGLSSNAHFFDGLVAAGLAPAHRVLSFDLRGRGLSDGPESGYTMQDHASDLLAALDELELERVLLGGHSFGGLLTLYVASKAPERVERAIVLDVPGEVDPAVLDQIGPSLSRLDQAFPSREAYLDFVRALPYFADGAWNGDLAAYYSAEIEELSDGTFRPRCRPAHIRLAVEGTFIPDWHAVAASVRCPTLLLRTTAPFGPPGAGPLMNADEARRTLARLSHGRLTEVPGNHITFAFGGHASHVAAEILAFLAEADSPGASG